MNITRIPQRVEIVFWVTVIPIMQDSTRAQDLIHKGYLVLRRIRALPFSLRLLALSSIGLVLGFSAGYLITCFFIR
jgi:hypothetical protein